MQTTSSTKSSSYLWVMLFVGIISTTVLFVFTYDSKLYHSFYNQFDISDKTILNQAETQFFPKIQGEKVVCNEVNPSIGCYKSEDQALNEIYSRRTLFSGIIIAFFNIIILLFLWLRRKYSKKEKFFATLMLFSGIIISIFLLPFIMYILDPHLSW